MIIVVSGLPRSGTSLVMQMLAAADVPIQQDRIRVADASNERGYLEWEQIKRLPREPCVLAECEGKAVKVVSSLLPSLPEDRDYRIVFVERVLAEVLASQSCMIARLGTQGGRLSPERMEQALEAHRKQVYAWLEKRALPLMKVKFDTLLNSAQPEAVRMASFLGLPPGAAARMASVADPGLRHHRIVQRQDCDFRPPA